MPVKVTVPELCVNVPLLVQLPATLIFVAWPVNVLVAAIVTLLNEVMLEPLIVLIPSNVTVPELCVNVPAVRDQLPPTDKFPDVEVNVPPESVKFPESVILTEPPVNVPPDWDMLAAEIV